MPKHHGMLFADRLMPSMLSGEKTQTRRPIKGAHGAASLYAGERDGLWVVERFGEPAQAMIACKWSVGDLIWCRETWAPDGDLESYWGGIEAFPDDAKTWESVKFRATASDFELKTTKWRPSIHMPKWACRCWKEITDVRVQRIQEITDADAMAEGIKPLPLQSADDPSTWWEAGPGLHQARSPRDSFCKSWSSIYPGSWERNDWVFALTFKPAEAPELF